MLAVMRHLQQQLAYSDERSAAVTQTDERVRRLQSVPNIGPVMAAAFVAALDDAARFRRAHEVEAYQGLVPRELSSGETQRRGRITQAGSSRVRWLLNQAAVSMLRLHDPRAAALREWASRIAAGRGKGIAVVALARRRAGILVALLRDGSVYESPPRALAAVPQAVPAERIPDGVRRAISRRFDGGVSAHVAWAAVAEPSRRWRPHPSTPLMRRRAQPRHRQSATRRMTEPRESGGHCLHSQSTRETRWRDTTT